MTTALQLVNRVRRRMREQDSSALTDRLSIVLLDLVNEAKRDVLEDVQWDFDKRQDGLVLAKGSVTSTTASVVGTLFSVTTVGVDITDLAGDVVSYAVVTSDADYGDTAFRIASASITGGNLTSTLANSFPGTTDLSASATIVIPEYKLPATVRKVLSVRHQEGDLRLHEVQKENGIDHYSPRPHEDTSDQPTDVYVGSLITTTYDTASASAGTTGIGMRPWPTPSSDMALHYSYIYRHPTLSSSQDLENVDPVAEDLIVRLAEARVMMGGIGNEPKTGALMETEVFQRLRSIHRKHERDPMRRRVLQPSFSGASSSGFGRIPRNVGSL